MNRLLVAVLMIALSGCSASVSTGNGQLTESTTPTSTVAGSTVDSTSVPSTTAEDGPASLQEHLATVFASMFSANGLPGMDTDSDALGTCIAKEAIRLFGVDALAKSGVTATAGKDAVSNWLDSMLMKRVLGTDPEPFDRYVDAMWVCGLDRVFASDFRTQLLENGNTKAAADCLVDKVIGDRYLRLVVIVGIQKGSTPNPQIQKNFGDPLVAAVDRAAKSCGVTFWGGS